MKIMIASDIHGSLYYCNALLDAYKKEKADRLLLLGDLLYHGPRNELPRDYAPKQVIECLNAYREEIMCVRGNCEAEVDQMVLEFPVLAEYALLWMGEHVIHVSHGHHFHPKNQPPLKKGDILLNGHTHVPKCEPSGELIYMNPGSVSIPKEQSAHSYMVWEDKHFIWKDVETMKVFMKYEYMESADTAGEMRQQ